MRNGDVIHGVKLAVNKPAPSTSPAAGGELAPGDEVVLQLVIPPCPPGVSPTPGPPPQAADGIALGGCCHRMQASTPVFGEMRRVLVPQVGRTHGRIDRDLAGKGISGE